MRKPIDILGLGVCTLDVLMQVEEFPGDAETVQRTEKSALQGGGPVSTALAAAATLGATTKILDRLGDDWRGDLIHNELMGLGVDVSAIQRQTASTSCLASVWVRRRDGARSIAFAAGSAREFASANELPEDALQHCHILHTNGRHWDACFSAALVVKSAGGLVSFDGGAHRFDEKQRLFLHQVDIAIVARPWSAQFAETDDLEHAAHAIREVGPRWVVITDGLRGSWIYPPDELPFHQPAYPLPGFEAIDTTGCGDVYHGAFLTGIARGWSPTRCARVASAMAALNTKGLGGRGHLVTLEGVESFANSRKPIE